MIGLGRTTNQITQRFFFFFFIGGGKHKFTQRFILNSFKWKSANYNHRIKIKWKLVPWLVAIKISEFLIIIITSQPPQVLNPKWISCGINGNWKVLPLSFKVLEMIIQSQKTQTMVNDNNCKFIFYQWILFFWF